MRTGKTSKRRAKDEALGCVSRVVAAERLSGHLKIVCPAAGDASRLLFALSYS